MRRCDLCAANVSLPNRCARLRSAFRRQQRTYKPACPATGRRPRNWDWITQAMLTSLASGNAPLSVRRVGAALTACAHSTDARTPHPRCLAIPSFAGSGPAPSTRWSRPLAHPTRLAVDKAASLDATFSAISHTRAEARVRPGDVTGATRPPDPRSWGCTSCAAGAEGRCLATPGRSRPVHPFRRHVSSSGKGSRSYVQRN